MVRKSNTNPNAAGNSNSDGYNAYIKELEAKLALYEKNEIDEGSAEIVVLQTDYIKIMSLLPYKLNLATREKGQGKIYKFEKIFQIKKIIYSDLVDILEVNREFLEAGYFIILSPKVVRLNGLDEIHNKILTKEKIEQILAGTDEGLALYSSANERQQKVIVELFVDKLIADPSSLDLNMVDRLSRLSGVNITQKAEESRQLQTPVKEEE
jgi:hypothetical protein